MPERIDTFLTEWHRMVAEKDLDALGALLADGVALGVPPYWEKLRGHALAHFLLGRIIHTIAGFTYRREWRNGSELALEFTGRIGELDLQGIDLITLDEQGRVANLDVMIRPINAVLALRDEIGPLMAEFLAQRSREAD
jgi:hypothetical protein